jgi:hypothetical protein
MSTATSASAPAPAATPAAASVPARGTTNPGKRITMEDLFGDEVPRFRRAPDEPRGLRGINYLKAKVDEDAQRIAAANAEIAKANAAAPATQGKGRSRRRKSYKMPRKMSRKYCKKTPCKKMGFTQRSSCRPYKNCFTRRVRRAGL